MSRTCLEVWGDPIAHSRSPALHRAAYALLGLDWSYERRRVAAGDFAARFAELDERWRGLSVTMPLKEEALAAADAADRYARVTGAANTVLLADEVRVFNTDVPGIVAAFGEHGVSTVGSARILGAGATASSALVALAEMGAERIEVRARRPERASGLVRIAEECGVGLRVSALDAAVEPVTATVATLPSGVTLPPELSAPLAAEGGALLDAAYAPWPSALASIWQDAPVISGLSMLLHQAVRQVRIFLHGDPEAVLPEEAAVVDVMRSALMGD